CESRSERWCIAGPEWYRVWAEGRPGAVPCLGDRQAAPAVDIDQECVRLLLGDRPAQVGRVVLGPVAKRSHGAPDGLELGSGAPVVVFDFIDRGIDWARVKTPGMYGRHLRAECPQHDIVPAAA